MHVWPHIGYVHQIYLANCSTVPGMKKASTSRPGRVEWSRDW